MTNYYCQCCNYNAKQKSNYEKHLKTKKHQLASSNVPFFKQNEPFFKQNVPFFNEKVVNPDKKTPYQCKYCLKYFKYSQGLSRHIKYTCKNNDDEDLKELVRLLNEQNQEMQTELLNIKSDKMNMQKQIDKLTNKLQIQKVNNNGCNQYVTTINGNIGNVGNTLNFQLLNYKDTNYDVLSEREYVKCIKSCNHCVKNLIEKVHFNKKHPENMNIYISSIKSKYIVLYRDNAWNIVDRKEQINDMYERNEMFLENWYDEYKEKYPEMIKSFNRYLKNRDTNEVLNKVKDEILLMLYNKRQMIKDQADELQLESIEDYENKAL
jgi:hypothetical protein